MIEIVTAGEVLVEVMRDGMDIPLDVPGFFRGPYPSGAPAIFIDTVSSLGHSSAIIGTVGKDAFGDCIMRRLNLDGVNTSLVDVNDNYSTAVAFVSYSKGGSRKFLYHIKDAAAGEIKMPDLDKLRDVKIFHVMGCSLMISEKVRDIINKTAKYVKDNGGLISFDPNIRVELLKDEKLEDVIGNILEMTDILIPGENEMIEITKKTILEEAVEWLLSKKISVIAIKRGKHGARLIGDNIDVSVKPFSIKEVDPTGAGDAFDAGFLSGYIEGLNPEKNLILANACGALNASYFGPMEGVFNRDYVEYFIKKNFLI